MRNFPDNKPFIGPSADEAEKIYNRNLEFLRLPPAVKTAIGVIENDDSREHVFRRFTQNELPAEVIAELPSAIEGIKIEYLVNIPRRFRAE